MRPDNVVWPLFVATPILRLSFGQATNASGESFPFLQPENLRIANDGR